MSLWEVVSPPIMEPVERTSFGSLETNAGNIMKTASVRSRDFLVRVCACLLFLAVVRPATAQPRPFQDRSYECVFVPGGITWTDAKREAESRSYLGWPGFLATDTSPAENTFLTSTFRGCSPNPVWLGGISRHEEFPGGPVIWTWNYTGEAQLYTRWAPGEPEQGSIVELSLTNGDWTHGDLTKVNFGYIVEYLAVPEPSTSLLVLGGLECFIARKARWKR